MSSNGSSVLKVRFDTSTVSHGKTDKKDFFRLAKDISSCKMQLLIFMLVTVTGSVTFAYLPKILGSIIDIYISKIIESVFGGEPVGVMKEILPAVATAAVLLLINVVSSFLQGIAVSRITSGYSHSLRCRMFEKFNRMPASFADNNSHGSVVSAVTENVDALNQSLGLFMTNVINSAVVIVAVTVMLFTVDSVLCIAAAAFLALSLVLSFFISRKEKKSAAQQQKTAANINGRFSEFYSGLRTVQESGEMPKNVEMLGNLNELYEEKTRKARFTAAVSSCLGDLTLGLCITAVAVIGAFRIKEDLLTIGTLMTAVLYVRRLHQPVSQISSYANIIGTLGEAAKSIFGFLDEKEQNSDGKQDIETGEIEFRNISFAYPGTYEKVLENFSATIPERGITSVSGETGVGKSTLVKLMLRFYEPDEGAVLCSGEEVSLLELESYRRKFTVINQEATLFEQTIAENIAYGKENASTQAIVEAAKLSGADEFISRLPDGYDTVFSASPQNISNGEVQLVLLARAFLNKTPYVVFDEATAFVDTKAELKIKETLNRLAQDSAVIIIAHRHSTVEDAEKTIRL